MGEAGSDFEAYTSQEMIYSPFMIKPMRIYNLHMLVLAFLVLAFLVHKRGCCSLFLIHWLSHPYKSPHHLFEVFGDYLFSLSKIPQ